MICNYDCFNCTYEDCVNDLITVEERKTITNRDVQAMKDSRPLNRRKQGDLEYNRIKVLVWQLENREKTNEKQKRYYERHKEDVKEQQAEYWKRQKEGNTEVWKRRKEYELLKQRLRRDKKREYDHLRYLIKKGMKV